MKRQTFNQNCINVGIFNPLEYIIKMYKNGYSCNEIAEYMNTEYDISITPKGISNKIKSQIPLRSYSERKLNAIKRGRMVYYKKPDSEKYYSKGLSIKIRFNVLKRDNFQCVLCGNSAKTGATLEIHHIKKQNNNNLENLQTLCFSCHRGLHYTNKKDN